MVIVNKLISYNDKIRKYKDIFLMHNDPNAPKTKKPITKNQKPVISIQAFISVAIYFLNQ